MPTWEGSASRPARYSTRSSSAKRALVELDADLTSGGGEGFDQLVRVVVDALACALDGVQMLVLVLDGVDLGGPADRSEHQVGHDRGRLRVADIGRDQLDRETPLRNHCRDREHHSATRPAVAALGAARWIVHTDA